MGSQPKSVVGMRAHYLLANFVVKSPDGSFEELKKILISLTSKITNEYLFLTSVYDHMPSALLGLVPLNPRAPLITSLLLDAMNITCDRREVRRILVALERSHNEPVLADLLAWTENLFRNEIRAGSPVRARQGFGQSFNLLFSAASGRRIVEPRMRELCLPKTDGIIGWGGIAVSGDKIIIGYTSGLIQIFNSTDMQCEMVFEKIRPKRINCLQCTSTEVIAGYGDGYVISWSMKTGDLIQEISNSKDQDFAITMAMQWKSPTLAAGFSNGHVGIWQYERGSFVRVGGWTDASMRGPRRLCLTGDYVVVLPECSEKFSLYDFDGQRMRDFETWDVIADMACQDGHVITAGDDGYVRIWDAARKEDCSERILSGHEARILCMVSRGNFLASIDYTGLLIIWSLDAALEGEEAELMRIIRPGILPIWDSSVMALGPNFIVSYRRHEEGNRVLVIDFQ